MRVFLPVIRFLFHLGYAGPFLMGILDSSFLVLPFGNDLMVVALVARHHHGIFWYVISAAFGSTAGALLLATVSAKLGEGGMGRIFGKMRYEKLKNRVGRRSGFAVALAGLAPPPFPFTIVIAAAGALGYPRWKTAIINLLARGVRFTILALLALKFGRDIVNIARSAPFEWAMAGFIALCLVASVLSVVHWLRQPRSKAAGASAGN
jgi:membrane protein YqaA with SNARE-associated domain